MSGGNMFQKKVRHLNFDDLSSNTINQKSGDQRTRSGWMKDISSSHSHPQPPPFISNDSRDNFVQLLQYDPPILSRNYQTDKNGKLRKASTMVETEFNYMEVHTKLNCTGKGWDVSEIEQLLDVIRPPVYFQHDDGEIWVEKISRDPVKCKKVTKLMDNMELLLEQRGAGPSWACRIRGHVFEECFDELLRQIGLDTPERATLLLRCRLEMDERIKMYTQLIQGVEGHIMRTTVLSEDTLSGVLDQIEVMQEENRRLTLTLNDLTTQLDQSEERQKEASEKIDKKNGVELEFLRTTNTRLRSQLDRFTGQGNTNTKGKEKTDTAQQQLLGEEKVLEGTKPDAI